MNLMNSMDKQIMEISNSRRLKDTTPYRRFCSLTLRVKRPTHSLNNRLNSGGDHVCNNFFI